MADSSSFATFETTVDLDGFRELFKVQQGPYSRKLGITTAVFCGLLALMGLLLFAVEPSLESFGFFALFAALVVLGVAMARNPAFLFTWRKPQIYLWFCSRGVEDPTAVELSDLKTTYRVVCGEHGFTLESPVGTMNVPWGALAERAWQCPLGVCFRYDDGKNSSVIHNLIGVNYASRKEDGVVYSLLLPTDVLAANPGLQQQVSDHIAESRAKYLGRHATATDEERSALLAWIDEGTLGKDDKGEGAGEQA